MQENIKRFTDSAAFVIIASLLLCYMMFKGDTKQQSVTDLSFLSTKEFTNQVNKIIEYNPNVPLPGDATFTLAAASSGPYTIDYSAVTGGTWTPKHILVTDNSTGITVSLKMVIDKTSYTATNFKVYLFPAVSVPSGTATITYSLFRN